MPKKMLSIFCVSFFILSCEQNDESDYLSIDLSERSYAGGKTTIFLATSTAFGMPAPNLSVSDLEMHLLGDAQFEAMFVTAPADVNSGLGPIFNNSSCISCHPNDGRPNFPVNLANRSGLLMRASIFGQDENGGPNPVPGFGLQIQNQAIFGFTPEARYEATFIEKKETFADGTVVVLQKPVITLVNPYTSLPAGLMLSPRIATPVFGLGLLEVIPEQNILARQDINDTDGDGISGKANYVWDPVERRTILGRFGWKANTGTLLVQCTAAYVEDMGITNYVFSRETGHGQSNGGDGRDDDPEIQRPIVDQVVLYCQTLAVPGARNINSKSVKEGARLFESLECSKCHTPKQMTGPSPISALAFQTIYPYTDMLLHDMGEDLADGRPDFLASGREWKTRPLWGIGLTGLVNGHTTFLHDGRAKNLTEAILWHGGEAEKAKEKFKQLSEAKRKALLDFLNSL